MVSLDANSSNWTGIGAPGLIARRVAFWMEVTIFAFCSPLQYNTSMREHCKRPQSFRGSPPSGSQC
jgi:hypothetical protein